MPERTSDGKYKWGNVKRNSRKELAQTVYGIWKGTGSKGSFSKFYHTGNPYGAKHRKDHDKKHIKESYQLNPLFEGDEVKHILGTITDEREKAFLIAAKKIAKDFDIVKNIIRDDNCIYVNLKDNYDTNQKEELGKALDTLVKGFHFGRSDFFDKDDQHSIAFFAMISTPTDRHGNDIYQRTLSESADFFKRPLFSKADVTMEELSSIIRKLKIDKDNPIHKPLYQKLLNKKYWQLRTLKVQMRHKGITKVPLKVIEDIAGSN